MVNSSTEKSTIELIALVTRFQPLVCWNGKKAYHALFNCGKVNRAPMQRFPDKTSADSLTVAKILRRAPHSKNVQNSSRAWNAIMRGVLSPPSPTPSRPVGGEVVYVSAPNPVCVEGCPGMPASTTLGNPKFGWLKTLKN